MRSRSDFILTAAILGSASTIAVASQWPFDPPDTAPPIGTLMGDYDSGDSMGLNLHRGIDMPKTVYTTVLAVEGGCVRVIDRRQGAADEQVGAIFIFPHTTDCIWDGTSESWGYSHVINAFDLKDKDVVSAGQPIGKVANFAPNRTLDAYDHLHMGRVTGTLDEHPINPLRFFEDRLPLQDPILDPNRIYFVRDQSFDASGFQTLNSRKVIFGDVDIVAEAHTKVINDTRPGVYAISYSVLQPPPGGSTIPERILARFNEITFQSSVSKAPRVYELTQSTDFQGHYVVTNAKRSGLA